MDKQPRPLAEMQAHAESFCAELAPYCERIAIAGSIRRRKAMCSDVELVCGPRFHVELVGLFDKTWVNELGLYATAEIEAGRWQHRLSVIGAKAFGERYKRVSVDGVALDLFSVLPPAQFGLIVAVRTGPADFSRRLVTSVAGGGWMPLGWLVRDGAIHNDGEGAVVPTPEERDVFSVLGRKFVEPETRA